ncbi:MAG: hypothetical protein FWB73_03605 [Treponema sp.]|nr:hypothetical protein [Treponema sp.]
MKSREDFIFTIGYDGPAAVIDGQAKKNYSKLTTKELAEKGLFRAAYASAVFSKDQKQIDLVLDFYNKTTGSAVSMASLQRLFGVFPVEVSRSIVL